MRRDLLVDICSEKVAHRLACGLAVLTLELLHPFARLSLQCGMVNERIKRKEVGTSGLQKHILLKCGKGF